MLLLNRGLTAIVHFCVVNCVTGEKLKLLEEREEEKEKVAAHGSKADKVVAEVEELKGKVKSIELEKTSLQTTVS